MLELGDDDLVPGRQRPSNRLGDQAEAVGRPAREDDFLAGRGADEALDPITLAWLRS
jgi:hypothetical protein